METWCITEILLGGRGGSELLSLVLPTIFNKSSEILIHLYIISREHKCTLDLFPAGKDNCKGLMSQLLVYVLEYEKKDHFAQIAGFLQIFHKAKTKIKLK